MYITLGYDVSTGKKSRIIIENVGVTGAQLVSLIQNTVEYSAVS